MPRSRMELDEPGAGLPGGERLLLGSMLKTSALFMSDRRVSNVFASESRRLINIANDLNIDQLSQQVLVPRLAGIEDSSRNWSVLMVLDHLCRVNRGIMETIELLNKDIEPNFEVDIADFKPDTDVDITIINRFEDLTASYIEQVQRLTPLKSRTCFYHPWFGHLTNHQWHCLAAYHMRIHRKQAHKITTMQGLA